jgi:hypothetical protein
MKDLLIGIGGTGQHLALAVSRFVFLGALPAMELAIIDADDNGPLSQSLKTFGDTVKKGYSEHPLQNGDAIYPPFNKEEKKDPQFRDLFADVDTAREIFELFYEEKLASIKIKEGMFGKPSVGATTFLLGKDAQLRPILEKAHDAPRVFITGSLVGGTGAGLIHQLINKIKERDPEKRIYGLIFLRWFQVPSLDSKQLVTDSSLDQNMRYGLYYFFDKTRYRLNASFLVGLPQNPPPEIKTLTLEAGKNEEKHHIFHLLAAHALQTLPEITRTEQAQGPVYAAAFESYDKLYQDLWGESRPLQWYINRALYLKEMLDFAGSDKFKQEILACFKMLFKQDPKHIGKGLFEVIDGYDKSKRENVINELIDTWQILAKQYDFCLKWLENIFGAFPEKYLLPLTKQVREDKNVRIKEIQLLWANSLPRESDPPPPLMARKLHEILVRSYQDKR